jgi:hypothetical protein
MPGCSFGQLGAMPLHHGTPRQAPARFNMELPNYTVGATIALVSEALRTEPTVDVIKLEHMRDRPLRFAHLIP